MAISEAVRKEVMERDHGECQFMHRQPVEATEISHFDHQGLGGLPPDHWKNQAPNLAASCGECHRKLHGGYVWEKFFPWQIAEKFAGDIWEDTNCAQMVIYDPSAKPVLPEDLWFYVRHEAEKLQLVEARIQGLAMIEGDVARDLYELSKGYKLLEPDARSFAQYIAGRNVDANRAQEAARAYGWMKRFQLEWPAGLTAQKADIVRKAVGDEIDVVLRAKNVAGGVTVSADVQAWLNAAVDQSVSDLKQELIDAGLMKASVRWYIVASLLPMEIDGAILNRPTLARSRKVEEVLKIKKPGDVVLRADKFVAGFDWDRKSGILSDKEGNVIQYEDLT